MKILVESDYHCGHAVGLTPPEWQFRSTHNKHGKYGKIQHEVYNFRKAVLKKIGPVDLHIINGDLIEGRGERSHGVELITADLDEQCAIAKTCIEDVHSQNVVITYGTPYHTASTGELCEARIACDIGAKSGAHEWVEIANTGIVLDIKHHIGTSSVPHGRHTAVARDNLWNQLWSLYGEQPRGRHTILIRSHAHYHIYAGGDNWLGIVTPALQGMGSRYGALKCSGHVNVGLIEIDINRKTGLFTWHAHIARIQSQRATSLVI